MQAIQPTLQQELAAAHREGLLTDAKEFQLTAIPDSQNAALVLQEATRLYEAIPEVERAEDAKLMELFWKQAKPTPATEQLLTRRTELLRLVEKAVSRPGYVPRRDVSNLAELVYPEYPAALYVGSLICLCGLLASTAGKPHDALKDIALVARLGTQIVSESGSLPAITGMGLHKRAGRAFLLILEHFGDRAEVLADSQTTRQALARDRQTYSGNPEREQLLNRAELALIHYWRALYKELTNPNVVGRPKRVVAIRVETASSLKELSKNNASVAVKVQKANTERLLRQQLVVVLQARHKTGALPHQLPLPTDPFSRKPLLYRPSKIGFVLYSVGENGKDDGGSEEKDITVRYSLS